MGLGTVVDIPSLSVVAHAIPPCVDMVPSYCRIPYISRDFPYLAVFRLKGSPNEMIAS